MKIAIIGSRGFDDYENLINKLQNLYGSYGYKHYDLEGDLEYYPSNPCMANGWRYSFDEIVSGGANGADKLGAKFAKDFDIKLTEFIPDWDKYGKRAGFLRNEQIVQAADEIVAFWDGISKGTGHSLTIAKKLKKTTHIYYF